MNRFRRRQSRKWLAAVAVVVALVLLAVWRGGFQSPGGGLARPGAGKNVLLAPGKYAVKHAVDGDTLRLENGALVRLLGVDTPEMNRPDGKPEPFAVEATEFSERFIHSGHVELSFDKERHDRYGRVLAYATVDGKMLNEELLRAGMGRMLGQFPYSAEMKARFRKAEGEAKKGKRGIWGEGERR